MSTGDLIKQIYPQIRRSVGLLPASLDEAESIMASAADTPMSEEAIQYGLDMFRRRSSERSVVAALCFGNWRLSNPRHVFAIGNISSQVTAVLILIESSV